MKYTSIFIAFTSVLMLSGCEKSQDSNPEKEQKSSKTKENLITIENLLGKWDLDRYKILILDQGNKVKETIDGAKDREIMHLDFISSAELITANRNIEFMNIYALKEKDSLVYGNGIINSNFIELNKTLDTLKLTSNISYDVSSDMIRGGHTHNHNGDHDSELVNFKQVKVYVKKKK